jgi:potassium channel subfamily K, other eukaryote
LFLLFNFTKRVRYIVALPATIILFYFACGILIGITSSMAIYVPPGQGEVYSQGFWYAVIAACLYLVNSMLLMVNMLGYFLGHYPQHFTLTDEQRNLILQTMMFFLWLAGGAAVFSKVSGTWSYVDALYFCDVTILTVGFGDFSPTNNVGRGLVLPFSVGGIIVLGLMVSSIHKFAGELSKDKVIRKHMETRRVNTLSRAVTIPSAEKRRNDLEKQLELHPDLRTSISSPITDFDPDARTVQLGNAYSKKEEETEPSPHQFMNSKFHKGPIHHTMRILASPIRVVVRVATKKQKELIMREEKDRFEAMRNIQSGAASFKKWYALLLSVIAFAILWGLGAVVFWQCEKNTQGWTYFQALYFGYVSLLTIGYGDVTPKSNAGKPFFVVWSLIAVPTMTILISDMADTVISSFKRGTFKLADFTVLPKDGIMKELVNSSPWLTRFIERRAMKKRLKKGFDAGPADEPIPTIEELVEEDLSEAELTRRLAFAIRRTADDMTHHARARYTYEEWVGFTRLIRFTKPGGAESLSHDEEVEGIVEWDWLDERSPMVSEQSEAEWVLDRLCESLLRLLRKNRLAGIAEIDTHSDPDSAATLAATGPSPIRFDGRGRERKGGDGEIVPGKNDGSPAPTQPPPTLSQERRRRATGVDTVLTFFTGERGGANAYAKNNPIWSTRALEKKIGERKRNSVGGSRKGPFKMVHRTGAIGGGRGGAGTRTLKGRIMFGSVDHMMG